MFTEALAMGSGGGSSVKSDTMILTASQTTIISTGLSSVNKFIISREFTNSGTLINTYSLYNKNADSSKYITGGYNGESGISQIVNIGSTPTYPARSVIINSISGGDISITAPSNSAWNGDYTWYAE